METRLLGEFSLRLLPTCRHEEVAHPARPLPQLVALQCLQLACNVRSGSQILIHQGVCRLGAEAEHRRLLSPREITANSSAGNAKILQYGGLNYPRRHNMCTIVLSDGCFQPALFSIDGLSALGQLLACFLQLGMSQS